MKTKLKHGRFSFITFVMLFMLINAISFGIGAVIMNIPLESVIPADGVMSFLAGLLRSTSSFLFAIIAQGLLLKWQFGWSLRRWLSANFVTIVLIAFSSFALNVLYNVSNGAINPLSVKPFMLPLILFMMGLAQATALRRYIQRAWLWIFVLPVTFALFVPMYSLIAPVRYVVMNTLMINLIQNSFIGATAGLFMGTMLSLLVYFSGKNQNQLTSPEIDEASETYAGRLQDSQPDDIEEIPARKKQKSSSLRLEIEPGA